MLVSVNSIIFGMFPAYLLIYRKLVRICMFLSRSLLICWGCNVFAYPYGVVLGCMHILNVFLRKIMCLLFVLIRWFCKRLCPLGDPCSAFGIFLCMALFNFFVSCAILIDLSCLSVITTRLRIYSSEHLPNFIICLSSTLSIRWSGTLLSLCCVGWNVWWNMDLARWFLDFLILVHRCGYFWNTHFAMLICTECILCIFSSGFLYTRWIPSFCKVSSPSRLTVFWDDQYLAFLCFFIASFQIQLDCIVHLNFVVVKTSEFSNVCVCFDDFVSYFFSFCIRFFAFCRDIKDLGLPVSTSQSVSSLLLRIFIQYSPFWFLFKSVLLTVVKLSDLYEIYWAPILRHF